MIHVSEPIGKRSHSVLTGSAIGPFIRAFISDDLSKASHLAVSWFCLRLSLRSRGREAAFAGWNGSVREKQSVATW